MRKAYTPVPESGPEKTLAAALMRSWPILDRYAATDLARAFAADRNVRGYLNSAPWEAFITALADVIPPMDLTAARAVNAAIGDFAPLSAGLSFTNVDEVAARYAETQAGRLIASITESQRNAVATVIAQSLTGQFTPAQAAARIRDSVGLHPAWARAVNTYRDRNLTRLIVEGKTAAAATKVADRMALTYRNRLIRTRSLTIARTEIQTASNLGRFAGWAQMIGTGVAAVTSTKEWAPGPGACRICSAKAGETVQWDRPFSGGLMMPPAHPNCRCTAVMIPAHRDVPRQSWLGNRIDAANGMNLSLLDDFDSPEY